MSMLCEDYSDIAVESTGSKWFTGGVAAAPRGRIQFDFLVDGVRYRPTIKRPPSEANHVAVIERSMMLTRTPPRDRPRPLPRSGGRLATEATAASALVGGLLKLRAALNVGRDIGMRNRTQITKKRDADSLHRRGNFPILRLFSSRRDTVSFISRP